MKIGAVEINLDALPLDELEMLASEAMETFCRRAQEQELKNKLIDVVTEAEQMGYKFVIPGLLLEKDNFGLAEEMG